MPQSYTVWFTGLPQSGKSTLARALADELRAHRGVEHLELLDGDVIRTELSRGLGFSREDRDENIRRITFLASVLNRNGVPAVVAAISPYREARARAREAMGTFVEVFCDASPDVCAGRDHKGNWARARAGELTGFTGVDDPYESPENPELRLDTAAKTPKECLAEVLVYLEKRGLIPAPGETYSSDEEAEVAARLEALGYI